MLSFFYEEEAKSAERETMEDSNAFVSGAKAPERWPRAPLAVEPRVPGGDFVGVAHRGAVERSARRISRRVNLLAAAAPLGGAGRMAGSVAKATVDAGQTPVTGLGRSVPGCYFCYGQKGGSAVGKTRRGKGTKCMVVVDGNGVPVGAQLASAQLAECRLAESTLAAVKVPRSGRGRPRSHLVRVIADRGYDSDPLRMRLHQRGTELIVPYRKSVHHRRFEDKRKLRRYRKRWKIERTNAWLQNFRRIQVRFDRLLTVFQGFFHLACAIITLRHLCN